MASEHQKVSILVGFGGTGGKVLRQFAELVAADSNWSERAPSHIYMALCDTDADDLDKAEAGIRSVFPSDGFRPYIAKFRLADGLGSFSRTVSRHWEMAADRGEAGVGRLQEKWWCLDGSPFTAHRVPYNIDEGAGQCPMVSYFLAWWQGNRVRDEIEALVAKIDENIPHGGDRPAVELTVVNSLAGGTGRGSWTVLTFLIRRALERHGWEPSAIGLFLDQGCFENVMRTRPEQRFKMKVNSLTGLSEVVMWTRLDDMQRAGDKPAYHLPELSAPERPDLDLIRAFTDEKGATSSPLGYAQVIFKSGRSGGLPDVGNYYTVAASALYARLSMPEVKSQEQNALPRIGGVGSSRVDVPFVEIEQYLRLRTVSDLLEQAADDDVERRPSIDKWLGCLRAGKASSGSRGGLVSLLEERLAEAAATDSMVQQFNAKVESDDEKGALNALRAICEGNLEAGKERLLGLLADLKDGPFSLEGKPAKVRLEDLGAHLINAIGRELRSDLSSLGTMQATAASLAGELEEVARELREKLRELLNAGSDEEAAEKADGAAATRLAKDLRTFAKKSLVSMFRKFDAGERESLRSSVPRVWVDETLIEVLRLELIPNVEKAARVLLVFAGNLERIVRGGLGGEWRREPARALAQMERDLFIRRVEKHGRLRWNLEEGFAEARSAIRYVHRRLRPCLDQSMIAETCRKLRAEATPRAIELELAGKLYSRASALVQGMHGQPELVRIGDEDEAAIRREIQNDVAAIQQSLHVGRETMASEFSFEKVVQQQLTAWQEVFSQVSGHGEAALCRDFELFYGISPERTEGGKATVPPVEDVLHHLVLSAARSCEPMLQIRPGYESERRRGDLVMASLPQWFGEKDSPAFQRLQADHGVAGIAARDWVYPSSNPYVLTVYANQGLSHKESGDEDAHFARVSSLDYWRDSDEDNIADWLAGTEDPDGGSVFSKEMRNSGLGYPDPTLVRDPAFAALRWRPWFRHEEAARATREDLAIDALLHAMTGHVGDRSSDETRAAIEALQERLLRKERHDWAMPNVRWESRRMWFQRDPVQVRENLPTASLLIGRAPAKKTLSKFVESIQEEDGRARRKVEALLAEREYFLTEFRSELGIGDDEIAALHRGLEDFLVELELEVSGGGGAEKDAFVAIVQRMLARHRSLRPGAFESSAR